VFVLYLNRPLLGKHRHHAGLRLAVLENLDHFSQAACCWSLISPR
jgi:hypothetical protein